MTDRPVVFITGASQGIGAETAREFARRGFDTLLLARNKKNLDAVADSVREIGTGALVCDGDLADLDFAEQAVKRCVEKFGRVDVLVNNAAWRELDTMRNISLESWERTLRISLTAPAFLARWCAPHMEALGKGVIINISSIQSTRVSGFGAAYMVAKGGLDTLTRELAVLYGPRGIRTVGLNPGVIDTEMNGDYESSSGESITETSRRFSEDMVPLGRWGRADEIARCIAMFATDDASYINGASILVDGGWCHNISPYSLKRMMHPDEY
jgi:NAD(P)-dependent dehydrogenase (short-subunit alcohol dehydrogenase family)